MRDRRFPGQAPFRVQPDDPGPAPDPDLDMRRQLTSDGIGRVVFWTLVWSTVVIGFGLLLL